MSYTGICEVVNTNIETPVNGASNFDLVFRTEAQTQKLMISTGGNSVPGITMSNNNVGIGKSTPAYAIDVIGDVSYSGNLIQNGIALKFCRGAVGTSGTTTATIVTFPVTYTTTPQVTLSCQGAAGYFVHANITAISNTSFSVISPCLGWGTPPTAYYGPATVYWTAIGY